MSLMRTLIVGALGQLGSDLAPALAGLGEVVGVDLPEFDIAERDSVARGLTAHRPDVVVNCAAWTNVEEAEDHADAALRVNALGALHVARAAAEHGARLVYISTDYVFGEAAGRLLPYVESDRPAPLNVYGATKLAGEHLTLAACPQALVVRTASLYGHAGARGKGGNFVETMLRLAVTGKPVRVVADQRMTPTSTTALSRALATALAQRVSGVLHLAARDACSWYEFAAAIFEHQGLKVDLTPIRAVEYPARARRASFSALGSERLEALGLPAMPTWREMLSEYLEGRGADAGWSPRTVRRR
jgi:dTDP-4-dehydrorhamnose reductase